MIGSLAGRVLEASPDTLLLDVGGVGYRVVVLPSLAMEATPGRELRALTHLHVREGELSLYGFAQRKELDFFKMLLGVPGVGPKSAMSVLAIASVDVLVRAISSGDSDLLTKVSGIGRKTSERIVVELKTRLERERPGLAEAGPTHHADVVEALVGLGYTQSQAREIVRKLPADIGTIEEAVKAALQIVGQRA